MSVLVAVTGTERTLWYVTLALGLVVALAVAGMLLLLLSLLKRIQGSVGELLESAGKVAENTTSIPQLEATAPVLEQIASEGVVQDGYMNALTQGYGEDEPSGGERPGGVAQGDGEPAVTEGRTRGPG